MKVGPELEGVYRSRRAVSGAGVDGKDRKFVAKCEYFFGRGVWGVG